MKFVIVTGSPKEEGLCHSVMEAIRRGASDGGAEVEVRTSGEITRCHVCNDGWGGCRANQRCGWGDDGFDEMQDSIEAADAVCFITPVYWHDMAEGLKCMLDRLRRCDNLNRGSKKLLDKPVLLVASAGGTGNGIVHCLDEMGRFCAHTGMAVFDNIGVNRWNSDYKSNAAYAAARAMAEGRKNGDTIDG